MEIVGTKINKVVNIEASNSKLAEIRLFISSCHVNPKSSGLVFIKRVMDIFISLFVIAFVLTWLIPLVGIIIWIDSKDSVFFSQWRNGLDMKPYKCLKFTTMHKNDDAHHKAATHNDVRITKIGRFLRVSCIDELPQFFNVLMGDMSVVGPRPHMISDNENFELKIHGYNKRHLVKPGITGLAQVKGYKGPINEELELFRRTENDIYYAGNYSILMDIRIIGKTITHIFEEVRKLW